MPRQNGKWLAIGLLVLAGCVAPAAEGEKKAEAADRFTLLALATFYRACTAQTVQTAGECRPWREAYERARAAFSAKYGQVDTPLVPLR